MSFPPSLRGLGTDSERKLRRNHQSESCCEAKRGQVLVFKMKEQRFAEVPHQRVQICRLSDDRYFETLGGEFAIASGNRDMERIAKRLR